MMKGRCTFTQTEAHAIRAMIARLRDSDSSEQKRIRNKLRSEHGFWITDFGRRGTNGFTVADFDALIESGRIHIH